MHKYNNFSNSILLFAGLLAGSLNFKNDSLESIIHYKNDDYVLNLKKDDFYPVIESISLSNGHKIDNYLYSVKNIAHMYIIVYDVGKNAGLINAKLYEGRHMIKEWNMPQPTQMAVLSLGIEHNTPAIRSYHVEVIDKGGNKTISRRKFNVLYQP